MPAAPLAILLVGLIGRKLGNGVVDVKPAALDAFDLLHKLVFLADTFVVIGAMVFLGRLFQSIRHK